MKKVTLRRTKLMDIHEKLLKQCHLFLKRVLCFCHKIYLCFYLLQSSVL